MGYSLILTVVDLYQKSHYCKLSLQEIFLFEALDRRMPPYLSSLETPLQLLRLPNYSGRPQIWNCLYSREKGNTGK